MSREPKIPAATITVIRAMAVNNRRWGAERMQGELRKLDIRVAKRTVQRHMRHGRPPRPHDQTWATFLRKHAQDIWACDFLQVTDALFRPLFAFFLTELGSRRSVHVGVTRSPTDDWVAQQLREATPFGVTGKYLMRDNDAKYGPRFVSVAAGTGIELLHTPLQAPRANAICERLLGSVRRECLDHILILGEQQLCRVLTADVASFNQARPHQGIQQQIPEPRASIGVLGKEMGKIIALPVLGGLHHDYRRGA